MVLEKEQGSEVTHRVLDRVGTSAARAIRSDAITAGGWYPIAWYRQLHDATHRVLGVDASYSRHMGYEATKAELEGIRGFFVRLMDPQSLLQLGARVFRTYFDRGYFRVLDWDSGRATGRWEDCHGFSEGIWHDVTGGIIAFLEASGSRNVRARLMAGGHDGDAFMDLEVRWR